MPACPRAASPRACSAKVSPSSRSSPRTCCVGSRYRANSGPSRWLYVGSSANRLFVSAFAACTGADPATIRWGGVNGGLTSGTFPQAIQIDGFTGPELAQIFVDGYLHPEQRAALEVGQHAGWTYRYLDKLIAITASPDTLYWYWVWPCCYEGPCSPTTRSSTSSTSTSTSRTTSRPTGHEVATDSCPP